MANERSMSPCGKWLFVAVVLLMIAVCAPLCIAQGAAAPTSATHAKGDIAGNWQGTLQLPTRALRLVLRIAKTDKGFAANFYSIDQDGTPITVSLISVDGAAVKIGVDMIGGTYQGTLSTDGNSMVGTWSQGPNPLPLTLVRATKETAWEIPTPRPPPKMMAADADPAFDVATIKPNDSGATSMKSLFINGRNFSTQASSLIDLICFSYGVQAKQVVGAPDWASKDRYDIAATLDTEGTPSPAQLRLVIRKLMTERFKLAFHKDKRDLSAYVLTVAKTGLKLKETESKSPLPGFGLRPQAGGITIPVHSATMGEFSGFLQSLILDRPVVNQTGLTARYDFLLTFTPDDSEFNGHPPPQPAKTDATEMAPNIFEAMRQDLGLKLEAQKTAVDVIAVDHVEKPSAN